MVLLPRIALVILVFFLFVLAYGYWHAKTHASLDLSVYDANADNAFVLLKDMEIILRDKEHEVLATGHSDSSSGIVYLSHPEIGSCYDAEQNAMQSSDSRKAWKNCFKTHSNWLMEWFRLVQTVDVRVDGCKLDNVPVVVKENIEDWWAWWIPELHGGGRPYTFFSLTMRIDSLNCRVIN